MRRLLLVVAAALSAATAFGQSGSLHRSVSASRQFTSYAANPLVPPALGYLAEQVKREWLRTLDLPDQWRDPIILVVDHAAADSADARGAQLRVFQTDLHLKFQVRWRSPPGIEQAALVAALIEALNAEYANRDQPVSRTAGYVAAPQPPWLTLGLARVIQGRDERLLQLARRSQLDGQAPRAALLLATPAAPPAVVERDLFEAHSWLFVQSLLALPDGAAKLRSFLTALGSTKRTGQAFWETYRGDFAGEPELERWWAVQFANRTASVVAASLSADETERRLAGILTTTVSVPDSNEKREVPVADLAGYTDSAWLRDAVTEKLARLANLHSIGSPLYRPVIAAYREAFQWLAQRNRVRFRRALARAENLQNETAVAAREIRSYVDAVELQHAPGDWAPDFAAAFQTLAELEQLEQTRRSPISQYLDQFER